MKAQTKAIVASVMVIALALTAVSGVTYSWFSDVDEKNITINTATVGVELKISDIYYENGIGNATVNNNNLTINNVAANYSFNGNYTIENSSSIKIVYRVVLTIDYDDTIDDASNIMMGIDIDSMKNLSELSDTKKMVIQGWKYLDDSESSISHTLLFKTLPEFNMESSNFSINIKVEAYQYDYPGAVTVIEDSGTIVSTESPSLSRTIDTSEGEVKTIVSFDDTSLNQAKEKLLTIETGESTGFQLMGGDSPVSIVLKLDSGGIDFGSGYVDVTVSIPCDTLPTSVDVVYNGSGDQPQVLSYSWNGSDSLTIVFRTSHFSEYVIIPNSTVKVSSEQALFGSVAAGISTIILGSDITGINSQLIIGNDCSLSLDLNGHDLSSNYAGSFIINNGSLTINDSTASNEGEYSAGHVWTTDIEKRGRHTITNNGYLMIEEGMFGFNGITTSDINSGAALYNYGEAIINGGFFTACKNYTSNNGYSYVFINEGGQLTINDAYANSSSNGMIAADYGKVIINGGSFILSEDDNNVYGMFYVYMGDIYINNGTFKRTERTDGYANRFFTNEDNDVNCGSIYVKKDVDSMILSNNEIDIKSLTAPINDYCYGLNSCTSDSDYNIISYSVNMNYVTASTISELNEKVKVTNSVITLNGNFNVTDNGGLKFNTPSVNLIIKSSSDNDRATIDMSYLNNQQIGTNGATIIFENINFKFSKNNYTGFSGASSLVFINCSFTGTQFLYAEECYFFNCTFDQDSAHYSVWTYGSDYTVFVDCKFNSCGKAILMYNEGHIAKQTVLVINCIFHSESSAGKAAIEIHTDEYSIKYTLHVNSCTFEGFNINNVSNNQIWNETKPGYTTVYVDGILELNPS